jgi:undecaprenyl pyrophosphate phosphatase UppP
MGMNPSSPEMTLLLVMLHTGTMFAVIVYFWKRWHRVFLQSAEAFKNSVFLLFLATILTGIVGDALIKVVEKVWFHNAPNSEIEQLFSHLELIAPALAFGGILILVAGILEQRSSSKATDSSQLNAIRRDSSASCKAYACPLEDSPVQGPPYRLVCLRASTNACGRFQLRAGRDSDSGS